MDLMNLDYKFNENVIYKDRGEMLMAYNQDSSDMYEFNEVGAEIFKMLAEEMSIKEIFNQLVSEYDVTEEDIYDDVKQIIDRLIVLNVIITKGDDK